MKSPENPSKDHYTDVEVSEKLGKSIMAVWKMANRGELPSKRVDGKRVYPKELIDSMPLARQAASGHLTSRSNTSGKNSTPIATEPRRRAKTDDTGSSKYFTLEQIAFALQRTQRDIDRMIQ